VTSFLDKTTLASFTVSLTWQGTILTCGCSSWHMPSHLKRALSPTRIDIWRHQSGRLLVPSPDQAYGKEVTAMRASVGMCDHGSIKYIDHLTAGPGSFGSLHA